MKMPEISLAQLILMLVLLFSAANGARAQQDSSAKLRLDQLNRLETKADEVVEVNIDGKMLDLAKKVLQKLNDQDAQKVGAAIAGLKGIYVKVFNFEKENQYDPADLDAVRAQLQAPKWERMVNVRSKKDNEKIDVFTMSENSDLSGLAVLVTDRDSLAVINVVGPLDIEMLAELSGHLAIPKLDIASDKNEKPKQ